VQPLSHRFNNGVPNQLTMAAVPYDERTQTDHRLGGFAQDSGASIISRSASASDTLGEVGGGAKPGGEVGHRHVTQAPCAWPSSFSLEGGSAIPSSHHRGIRGRKLTPQEKRNPSRGLGFLFAESGCEWGARVR